jgi:cell division protein FtsW (lipid II flippase)
MKSMPIPERPTESRAGDVLLLPIAGLAFWTLAYDLVLVLRWPAKTITWCFLAMALAGFFLLARLWKKTNSTPDKGYRFHLSQIFLLVLGFAYAITILFVRRPNQDDVVYLHRALSQLSA